MKASSSSRANKRAKRLAVLTPYFNPAGYQTRRRNFRMFADAALSQGADLWVIEAGTPGAWEVEERAGLHIERVEMSPGHSLWQKERMLNVLIGRLPPEYQDVAWIDGDLLFDNPDWPAETIAALRQFPVCQLFSEAVWLSPHFVPERWLSTGTLTRPSIPAAFAADGKPVNFGIGHPGFAWAARRSVIESLGGLYDLHVMGSGDTIMAIGLYGWLGHVYLERFAGPFRAVAERWIDRAAGLVRGNVGMVAGAVRHLWHGSRADRQYDCRLIRETIARLDTARHLKVGGSGLWEWTESAPMEVREAVNEYFYTRKEDGDASPVAGTGQDSPATIHDPRAG